MLVLASSSPRRSELLTEWGYEFGLILAPVNEEIPPNVLPQEAVQDLARRKAISGFQAWHKQEGTEQDLILGADTIVVLGNKILGKPLDEEDAEDMLQSLSGKTHQVMTGIALVTKEGDQAEVSIETGVEITSVTFREISSQEIKEYISTGEPMDKAAAYAIQGKAREFATVVEGSITNVVGLPMEMLTDKLKQKGICPCNT